VKSFEELWAEAGARFTDRKVRLACTAEVVGIGAVGLIALRCLASDGEVLEFVCPRCSERHESLLIS
jgi:hypothetical protein